MQNIEMVNNYNIHDYMSIVDLRDQCLMTVSHPLRWISVLNFVFCGTLFVSLPPFLFVTILSTLFRFQTSEYSSGICKHFFNFIHIYVYKILSQCEHSS
jgi:hypothetical protein